jgi:hypothetical protein
MLVQYIWTFTTGEVFSPEMLVIPKPFRVTEK